MEVSQGGSREGNKGGNGLNRETENIGFQEQGFEAKLIYRPGKKDRTYKLTPIGKYLALFLEEISDGLLKGLGELQEFEEKNRKSAERWKKVIVGAVEEGFSFQIDEKQWRRLYTHGSGG